MHGGDEKCIQNILSKNLKGRDYMEDLSIDGKIILAWILRWEGVDWHRIGTSSGLL
jgi:hypothetical protein